jgi:hypothetical protein
MDGPFQRLLPRCLTLSAALLATSSFLFAEAARSATVNISGVTPPFPGYGTAVGNNNVVDSGLSGVSSGGALGSTFKGSATGTPAIVTTDLPLYNVDWYFVGSESGFVNTLVAPGINAAASLPNSPVAGQFNEHDQNNNCAGCSHPSNPGPLFLGTSLLQTSAILNFSIKDDHGSNVANGAGNPNPGSNGVPSIIFSYLTQTDTLAWKLTSDSTSAWFLFAFNDKGGPDSDFDDIVGAARVYCSECAPPVPSPLPAALPLFAGGLGLLTLMARRKKKNQTTAG